MKASVVLVAVLAGGGVVRASSHGEAKHAKAEHGDEHAEAKHAKAEHGDEHAETKPAKAEHGDEHAEAKHAKAEHGDEHAEAKPDEHAKPAEPAATAGLWSRIQGKVEHLAWALREAERLQAENARLRMALAEERARYQEREAQAFHGRIAKKLEVETGSKTGRLPAGIRYRPPAHLNATQLYTLGVSYFQGREDEKAAVIFAFLAGLEGAPEIKTPELMLMAAASWYRIDHLELAAFFADEAVAVAERAGGSEKPKAQARLWKSLVAARRGERGQSQELLRQLIDHHPHAPESGWINGRGRSLASEGGFDESVPIPEKVVPGGGGGGGHGGGH